MTEVTIATDDIVGLFNANWTPHGSSPEHGFVIARITVSLAISFKSFNSAPMGSQSGKRQVCWAAKDVACALITTSPKTTATLAPPHWMPRSDSFSCSVSGEVILEEQTPNVWRVRLGSLECRLTGPDPDIGPAWLFWPENISGEKKLRDFVIYPDGSAIRGELTTQDIALGAKVTLLLPRADSGDVGWSNTGKPRIYSWSNGRDISNATNLVDDLKPDAVPDSVTQRVWPESTSWCARRWRMLARDGEDTQKLLQAWAETFKDNSVVTLSPGAEGEPGSQMPDYIAANLYELRDVGINKPDSKANSLIVEWTCNRLDASFSWPSARRSMLFTKRMRAGLNYMPKGSGNVAVCRQLTFSSLIRGTSAAEIAVRWKAVSGELSSQAQTNLSLYPAAIAREPGWPAFAGRARMPSHLWTQQGTVELPDLAAMEDKDGNSIADQAEALLAEIADSGDCLRGGVPLSFGSVPGDLVAWSVEKDQVGGVQLRLSASGGELLMWQPVLTWRTPAWWILEGNGSGCDALGRGLDAEFGLADADEGSLRQRLADRLKSVTCETMWVGRAGSVTAQGWDLSFDSVVASWTIPALISGRTLWAPPDQRGLLTILAPVVPIPGGSLLDPSRGWVPMLVSDKRLTLSLRAGLFPSFSQHPWPLGATAIGELSPVEVFHPLIGGLTGKADNDGYNYRHPDPVLSNARAHMTVNGSFSQLALDGLDETRTVDDIAILVKEQAVPGVLKIGADLLPPSPGLAIAGWVPGIQVPLVSTSLDLGFISPKLELSFELVGDSVESLVINEDAGGFNSNLRIAVDTANRPVGLERATGPEDPRGLRGFGQPLLFTGADLPFIDGIGRRWDRVDQGRRRLAINSSSTYETQTLTARVTLNYSGSPTSLLGLAVFNVSWNTSVGDQWDLVSLLQTSGMPSGAPRIGPHAILPLSLDISTADALIASCRLGPPQLDSRDALKTSDGSFELTWKRVARDWVLVPTQDGKAGTFDWRPFSSDDAKVRRLEGDVLLSHGELSCQLRRLTIASPIGDLAFDVESVDISVAIGRPGATVVVRAVHDSATGFGYMAELSIDAKGHWTVSDENLMPPNWRTNAGGIATVTIISGQQLNLQVALHPTDDSPDEMSVIVHQCDSKTWLFSAVRVKLPDSRALVGVLRVESSEIKRTTPALTLAVRGTMLIQPNAMFEGAKGGALRGDLHRQVTFGLAPVTDPWAGSTITGHVDILNRYCFDIKGEASVELSARIFLADVALSPKDGHLPDEFIAHVTHVPTSGPSFQLVQRFTTEPGAGPHKVSSYVLAVIEERPRDVPQSFPQIAFTGESGIALARERDDSTAPKGNGLVVRVPFATGTPINLQVPLSGNAIKVPWRPEQDPLRWVGNVPAKNPSDPWHWRGPMAWALSPQSLCELIKPQCVAAFQSGVLPSPGEELPEWGTLLHLDGRHVAGLLVPGGGVRDLPFYASVSPRLTEALEVGDSDAGKASRVSTIPVTLLVPSDVARDVVIEIASAMLAIDSDPTTAFLNWGRSELRRRNLRGSGIVVARGRSDLVQTLPRAFEIASMDDVVLPGQAPSLPQPRSGSELLDRLTAKDQVGWAGYRIAASRTQAAAELIASEPLQDGAEVRRRHRILNAGLLTNTAVLPSDPPLALTSFRSLRFKEGDKSGRGRWPVFRTRHVDSLVDVEETTPAAPVNGFSAVTPPWIDAFHWSDRPGDTLTTVFSFASDGETGPTLSVSLREARPQPSRNRQRLIAMPSLDVTLGETQWTLHRFAATSCVGVASKDAAAHLRVTMVSPRTVLELKLNLIAAAAVVKTESLPELSMELTVEGQGHNLQYSMTDPLMIGLFSGEGTPVQAGKFAIARPGILESDHPVSLSTDTIVWGESLLGSSDQADQWKNDKVNAIVLREVTSSAKLPNGSEGADPKSYLLADGNLLRRLVDAASTLTPRPWLLNENPTVATSPEHELNPGSTSGREPLFVWLSPEGDGASSWKVFPLARLAWRSPATAEPPSQMLVSAADRYLGFGNTCLISTLAISSSKDYPVPSFELRRISVALEASKNPEARNISARLFGPSGGMVSKAPL